LSPPIRRADLAPWLAGALAPLTAETAEGGAIPADDDLDPPHLPPPSSPLSPAAVLVGLVEREEGLSVILTRRADTLRRHTGQIALPGGRSDPGEAPWETALREAHEEIGLAPECVELAGLSTPYRTGTGFRITPVVGFVSERFEPRINPHEVADIFEAPFGFLMDPANHEQKEHETAEGYRRRFYAMTWRDRVIWGATAGMLRALYRRLYGGAVG
jgi:8-oxo-dGTP pyrophosphatase MutT (NUDIX family)